MNIATITIYCNEWFRLDAWTRLYEEYKNEVYMHIIVNNGIPEDNDILHSHFPNSIIIYSQSKNMTLSYNLGVKEALKDKKVDAIMQITNDIKFESGTLSLLYKKLVADPTLAVIGPVVLKKDSDIIECFGYKIKKYYGNSRSLYRGQNINDLKEDFRYVSCIPGGAIMIRRSAYEKFGYQDENIHMYCDERDMYIRFDKLGYKEGVLCSAKAWHQHIFKPGSVKRGNTATYYTLRNRMYITSKHNNKIISISEFIYLYTRYVTLLIINAIKNGEFSDLFLSAIKGLKDGFKGDMSKNPQ